VSVLIYLLNPPQLGYFLVAMQSCHVFFTVKDLSPPSLKDE
jgi:hypothetical protein